MSETAQGTKPSFGFGSLDDFEPRGNEAEAANSDGTPAPLAKAQAKPRAATPSAGTTAARAPASSRAADEAAARLGFQSREPLVRRRKRQPIEEPVEQINLRAAVADINVFIEWCENNRYSYREGFAELVKHIDAKAA